MISLGKTIKKIVNNIKKLFGSYLDASENTITEVDESLFVKFSLKHLKNVIIDDFNSLKKDGIKEFFLRWWRRKRDVGLFAPYFIKNFFVKRKQTANRKIVEEVTTNDKVKIATIPEVLSVVINTKNSPTFFKEILQKYKYQKGFKTVEIIIVDSGSTDNTLPIARELNCKIIEIKAEQFRHGRSRNIGVEAAIGKYIINTVSDAIPTSLDMAYKLAMKLEENKATAISVRQIPRFDADLFAVWSVWQHSNFMFSSKGEEIWVENINNFDSLNPTEKRKISVIEDVFVMHDAKQIKNQKYDNETRFAEDLLLSINYIRKGNKIGLITSEAVIHSHSRTPEYFLKRYFTDSNTIYNLLESLPSNFKESDLDKKADELALNDISYLLSLADGRDLGFSFNSESWVNKYLGNLKSNFEINLNIKDVWNNLYSKSYGDFKHFLDQTSTKKEQLDDVKLRIAATTSATLLSEYLIKLMLRNKLSKKLSDFNDLMEQGI